MEKNMEIGWRYLRLKRLNDARNLCQSRVPALLAGATGRVGEWILAIILI